MTGNVETISGTGCMLPAQWLKPSRTKRLTAFLMAKSLCSLRQSPRVPMLILQSMHQPACAALLCCAVQYAAKNGQCDLAGYAGRLVGCPHW